MEEAIRILREGSVAGDETESVVGDAGQAFLALCLHDNGHHSEALKVALQALAPTLPRYQRAVNAYAGELVKPESN